MPFSGYLKIPDIDGEAISAGEVIKEYDSLLTDEAELLLRLLGRQDRIDSFDFRCETYERSLPTEELTLNYTKIKFVYEAAEAGRAGLREARAYAAELEKMLDDKGLDLDFKVKSKGEGYYQIKLQDILVSSYQTGGAIDGKAPGDLTGAGDLDFLL